MDFDSIATRLVDLAEDPDNAIYRAAGTWLATCLLSNQRAEILVERTPWDISSYGQPTSEGFDLSQYESVGDFLDNESTGNTVATYLSGSGFAAELYAELLSDEVVSAYRDYLWNTYPELRDVEWEGALLDSAIDELEDRGVGGLLFEERFREMPLLECLTKHLSAALEQRELRRIAEARRLRRRSDLMTLAGEAVEAIENGGGHVKWTKSNWDGLLALLQAAVERYGQERVGAALAFCTLNMSHSVAAEIKKRFRVPDL